MTTFLIPIRELRMQGETAALKCGQTCFQGVTGEICLLGIETPATVIEYQHLNTMLDEL